MSGLKAVDIGEVVAEVSYACPSVLSFSRQQVSEAGMVTFG